MKKISAMQLLINKKILEYFKADLSFFKARVYAISCKKKKYQNVKDKIKIWKYCYIKNLPQTKNSHLKIDAHRFQSPFVQGRFLPSAYPNICVCGNECTRQALFNTSNTHGCVGELNTVL